MRFTDAIVVEWGTRAGTIDFLKDGLFWGLERNGFAAHRVSIEGNDAPALIRAVDDIWKAVEAGGGAPFVIDTQARSPFKTRPRFSFILDHPLDHPNLREVGTGTVLGLCDASHLALTGYTDGQTVFFPHAGLAADPDPLPFEDRPIDLLFAGGLGMAPHGASWAARLAALTPQFRWIVEAACADVVAHITDPYLALVTACAARGVEAAELDWERLCDLVTLIGILSQGTWRSMLLEELKHLNLVIAGPVAPDFFIGDGGSVRFLGTQSYNEIQTLMRQTKVVLNITPKFKAGSHERIWSAMAAGAVVCTNPSHYMARDFIQGESLLFQSSPEETRETLAQALARPARLQAMAATAAPIYAANHTFEARVRDHLVPLFGG
ncbi:glycosyltransferase [Magnetospira sp. QH-2]|uniref:glycosyltransferase family protein n=1 Tax=Magnetospira sp. (strain QH-2) TaxID=1288970 RepID=UPI0003E812C9|nr:glycosyltransferase [Magnetospira sp. QH-2]CCQ74295.1 Protein of unknown function [Magnetospira sp. QH-2]